MNTILAHLGMKAYSNRLVSIFSFHTPLLWSVSLQPEDLTEYFLRPFQLALTGIGDKDCFEKNSLYEGVLTGLNASINQRVVVDNSGNILPREGHSVEKEFGGTKPKNPMVKSKPWKKKKCK